MSPAPILKRIAAFFIDQALLLGVVLGVGLAVGVGRNDDNDAAVLAVNLLGVAAAIAYHTIAIAKYGRTLGKQLMGLRVVALPEGAPVVLSYAALQALVPSAAGLLPVVGAIAGIAVYAWALSNPSRLGLHDKLAGTMVVPANAPLDMPPGPPSDMPEPPRWPGP